MLKKDILKLINPVKNKEVYDLISSIKGNDIVPNDILDIIPEESYYDFKLSYLNYTPAGFPTPDITAEQLEKRSNENVIHLIKILIADVDKEDFERFILDCLIYANTDA